MVVKSKPGAATLQEHGDLPPITTPPLAVLAQGRGLSLWGGIEWIGAELWGKAQCSKKLIGRMPERPASAHSDAVVISVPGGQSYAGAIRYFPEREK